MGLEGVVFWVSFPNFKAFENIMLACNLWHVQLTGLLATLLTVPTQAFHTTLSCGIAGYVGGGGSLVRRAH